MTSIHTSQPTDPPKMRDVARKVGVSISTVSRVMAGRDVGDPELRRRIMRTVRDMGYRKLRRRSPRTAAPFGAGELIRGKTGNIAFVSLKYILDVAVQEESYYHAMLTGIYSVAEQAGYHVVVSTVGPSAPQRVPSAIEDGRVDGAVIAAHMPAAFVRDVSARVPVVLLNTHLPWPAVSSVLVDNRLMMFKAVNHLAELGHKRIAFFLRGADDPGECRTPLTLHHIERRRAFVEALDFAGVENDPALYAPGYREPEQCRQAIPAWLDRLMQLASPPTAIITGLGRSLAFIQEINKRGMEVPRDLSLVATDDSTLSTMITPHLTSLSSNYEHICEWAVKVLRDQIGKGPAEYSSQMIRVEPKLIVRDSTGPAKA